MGLQGGFQGLKGLFVGITGLDWDSRVAQGVTGFLIGPDRLKDLFGGAQSKTFVLRCHGSQTWFRSFLDVPSLWVSEGARSARGTVIFCLYVRTSAQVWRWEGSESLKTNGAFCRG